MKLMTSIIIDCIIRATFIQIKVSGTAESTLHIFLNDCGIFTKRQHVVYHRTRYASFFAIELTTVKLWFL